MTRSFTSGGIMQHVENILGIPWLAVNRQRVGDQEWITTAWGWASDGVWGSGRGIYAIVFPSPSENSDSFIAQVLAPNPWGGDPIIMYRQFCKNADKAKREVGVWIQDRVGSNELVDRFVDACGVTESVRDEWKKFVDGVENGTTER